MTGEDAPRLPPLDHMAVAQRSDSISTGWSETVLGMTGQDESRDAPATQRRAARVAARQRGMATARRLTGGLALTVAAAASGTAGVLAATGTATAPVTTSSRTTSSQQSGIDDWGSVRGPRSAYGQSGHTSTSGS